MFGRGRRECDDDGFDMYEESDSSSDDEDDEMLTALEFDHLFNQIDTDGNGTLSKEEMVEFIKLLTGL